ncbi:hypothetical protein HY003_02295 [Candidatus Saccharibacteria bacterium]|nr:hypothetical protein [Candidatus Saccharibacteria bacterium]MBI3338106.1 hypothetical protein [Candidatus Saccharibacteria bacterium]
MKIVVTNPSGLTDNQIQELKQLGEVAVYNDTNNDNYAERVKDAEIAVLDCFLTPVTSELLAKTPDLKFFSINSTGFDKVDVEATKNAGVIASNVPHFSTNSVAEMAIGLMFAANRKIALGDKEFRNGLIAVDPGTPEQTRYSGFDLIGKTLGVVGLGDIGSRIAEIGNGIGMSVIAYNRTEKDLPNVKQVSLQELFEKADVVVLALALNDQTKGIITKELIENMKKSAIFVSIAGLGLIDQDALKNVLNNDLIAGTGIDTASQDWAEVKNAVLTPHNGYNTRESDENMGRIITENIKAYIDGKPINRIDS